MRLQGYYEGTGATQAIRISRHHKSLLDAVTRIAKALHEPLPDGSWLPPPTIRRASTLKETVKDWQRILNDWRGDDADLVVDGNFGKYTEVRTKEWQSAHGLKADGVVGKLTWRAAEAANGEVSIVDAEADTNPGIPAAKNGQA
jgi:peptidoglycan hydrolase-like protein with peptidoglycan-binding domain